MASPPPERLYAVNATAARFYADRLPTSAKAADYLHSHGITAAAGPDTPWQIGYAPGRWTDLATHLTTAGYTPDDITAAGLGFRHRTSGHLLDRFRDRLMFPITDHHNHIVGFTARDLSGRADATWINTPETTVYRKRQLLYGLGQQLAHPPTGDGDPVVFLAEGAADVIAIHHMAAAHAIFPDTRPVYAVAPCGTNLTREQLDLLNHTLPGAHLVLTFDGDQAGRRALSRAYPTAKTWPGELSGSRLPEGQDPADLLAANGPMLAIRDLVDTMAPLALIHMTHTIEDLFTRRSITNPAAYAADRLTAYQAIADLFIDAPHASRQMAEAAAEQLGIDPTDVVRGIIEARNPHTEPLDRAGPDPPAATHHPASPDPPPPTEALSSTSEPATVSASARTSNRPAADTTAVATRHYPHTGTTVWALAHGIGQHPEAAAAASMAADIATTVALRSAPAAGINAARAALNAHYDGIHPGQTGDASLIVIAAYPSPQARHGVRFELAWTGDCRAYTIRAGQLAQITADHTTARQRRDTGQQIRPGSIGDLLLTSSVRAGDISACPLEHGPLLVCNNKLHRTVPDTLLATELSELSDAQATADRLAAAVGSHHTRDTAVLLIHARTAPPSRVTTVGPGQRTALTTTASAAALALTSFASPASERAPAPATAAPAIDQGVRPSRSRMR